MKTKRVCVRSRERKATTVPPGLSVNLHKIIKWQTSLLVLTSKKCSSETYLVTVSLPYMFVAPPRRMARPKNSKRRDASSVVMFGKLRLSMVIEKSKPSLCQLVVAKIPDIFKVDYYYDWWAGNRIIRLLSWMRTQTKRLLL